MIGRTLAFVSALLISGQVYAQANPQSTQGDRSPAQGVTSGPAAGSSASMKSPQAGSLATKHQKQVLRRHNNGPANGETGATVSSSPSYTRSGQ